MYNNPVDKQNFIKNLLAVAPKHCDNCGSKYSETDFKVIRSSPANTVLHLRCKVCNNAYMLNVLNPQNGLVGAQRSPVNIDLVYGDELQKFAGQNIIERNEAIDTHKLLSDDMSKEELLKLLS